MGKKDKKSLRQRLQDAMSTPNGQIVMNYAYNWGASVVIMGTLFKLTHLPGANFMLFAGMGTEVIIFFLSAFDLSGVRRKKDSDAEDGKVATGMQTVAGGVVAGVHPVSQPVVEGTEQTEHTMAPVQNQGNVSGGPAVVFVQGSGGTIPAGTGVPAAASVQGPVVISQNAVSQPPIVEQSTPVPTVSPVVNEEMEKATEAYMEQLKSMTDILSRCTSKAEAFSQDADQLANLGKTLSGINALYEMQLRTVSTQIGTIDQVHEQTRKMARQIEELNEVYARMLQAMTSRQV